MSGAVLITGASGLVGAAVAASLRRAGRPVLGLDLKADGGSDVLACDLCDAQQLEAIAEKRDIAAIVHCGAVSGPALYRDDPGRVARINIGSTTNLLELARTRNIRRFVFASSGSVYGRTEADAPIREERVLHASSVYAATKIAGEALVEAYSRQYGLNGVSLRIAAVYGPARATPCLIRDMILAGQRNAPLTLPFGRDQRYHYIHVDDVAAAVIAAVEHPDPPKPAYTIAADRGLTLAELADLIREIVPGPKVEVRRGEDPLSDPQGPYDLAAAQHDLGWQPAVDLRSGIQSYANFLASEKVNDPLQINSIA